jgi:stearoyl-CoA desaturase (Delta-9 desaturase)
MNTLFEERTTESPSAIAVHPDRPEETLGCTDPCLVEPKDGAVQWGQQLLTLAIVLSPVVALAVFIPLLWGHAVSLGDLVMAAIFYLITGFGVTIGYHRLLTHSSFKAQRWLKIALAVAGSMAVEGSSTSWVATHRRHHIYSDRPGDPHSPHRYGSGTGATLKGLFFAHMGWLFVSDASNTTRYAPDMLKDPDLQLVDRLFPLLALGSLAVPLGIGYALVGTVGGAITAMVWAGFVRMALLHHVTWGVNSLCHSFGRRSNQTSDKSTNLWPLAVISLGDSWHNVHHAHPVWARHGARRGMLDPSGRLIDVFERFGWVKAVRRPTLPGA